MAASKHSRRRFLKWGAAGAGAMAAGMLAPERTQAARRRPNIVFILADDLGYGDVGCFGQDKIETPNLDRMAARGMKLTAHYSGSTVCAPSRCCFMTGYHTGHAVVRGNKPVRPLGQHPLPAREVTVAEVLKKAGYATGAAGKWGLGPPDSEGSPNRQGFDFYYGYNCQRNAHFYYPDFLWRNETKEPLPGNRGDKEGTYSHDLIADEALKFIRRHADRPFFLYVPFTIPHAELAVPEDSLNRYRGKWPEEPYPGRHYGAQKYPRAAFAGMVTRMDRDVGRILDLLRKLDLEEDTLVLFSSDNGPHHEGGHDPQFFDSNGPLRGIKRDLYEGGIRVPTIAHWPGRVEAGTVSDHPSAFWDFLPTAAELAGVEPPSGIDGISYLPALLGRDAEQEEHDYLYWEFPAQGGKQAVRAGRWKAVRLQVRKNPDGPIELYDLETDIGEEHDVAAEHPDLVGRMNEIMQRARTESDIFPLT